jgi:hypothetical protein
VVGGPFPHPGYVLYGSVGDDDDDDDDQICTLGFAFFVYIRGVIIIMHQRTEDRAFSFV